MSKKSIYIAAVAVVALATIIISALWLNITKQYDNANPLNHIPADANYVVKIESLQQLLSVCDSVDYSDELTETLFASIQRADIDKLTNFLKSNSETAHLDATTLYVAKLPSPDENPDILIITKLRNHSVYKSINRMLTERMISQKRFESGIIYALGESDRQPIYIGLTHGIACIGNSQTSVANSLKLKTIESIGNDGEFMELHRTLSNTVQVSIIMRKGELTTNFCEIAALPDNFLSTGSKWIEFDLGFRKNMMYINGFILPDDSCIVAKLQKESSGKSTSTDRMVPHNASLAIFSTFNETSEKNDSEKDYPTFLTGESVAYHIRIDGTSQMGLVIMAADSAKAISEMHAITGAAETDIITIKPYEDKKVTVFKSKNIIDLRSISDVLPGMQAAYYCWYNGAAIIATNAEVINHNIQNQLKENTLNKWNDFERLKDVLSNRQQLMIYSDSKLIEKLLGYKENNQQLWSKTGSTVLQLSPLNNMIYITAAAIYSPFNQPTMPQLWEIRPDTLLAAPPQTVINHNTKEEEILLNDKAGNFYLTNSNGIILWKKRITGKMIGQVRQIDLFKNGKLQYLFNDDKAIYVIDRNGENVEPFPISLSFAATNQVASFDYDNDGNYRFMVAGDDNSIHLFDKYGKIVDGFNPQKTVTKVTSPIEHFRNQGKDYIIYHDSTKIYITDRKGNERIRVNNNTVPQPNSPFYISAKNSKEAAIYTLSAKNELIKTTLSDGKTEAKGIYFGESNTAHLLHLWRSNQFLMIVDGKLLIIDEKGEVKFTAEAASKQIGEATVVRNSAEQQLVAYTDRENNNIYVTDQNGMTQTGFPISSAMLPTTLIMKNQKKASALVYYDCNGSVVAVELNTK